MHHPNKLASVDSSSQQSGPGIETPPRANSKITDASAAHADIQQDSPMQVDRLRREIEKLSEELRVKEAALQNRRAVLAQTETHLHGQVQELSVELAHERQRRRKREGELNSALREIAEMRAQPRHSEALRGAEAAGGSSALNSASATRVRPTKWRLSSGRKRRWRTS